MFNIFKKKNKDKEKLNTENTPKETNDVQVFNNAQYTQEQLEAENKQKELTAEENKINTTVFRNKEQVKIDGNGKVILPRFIRFKLAMANVKYSILMILSVVGMFFGFFDAISNAVGKTIPHWMNAVNIPIWVLWVIAIISVGVFFFSIVKIIVFNVSAKSYKNDIIGNGGKENGLKIPTFMVDTWKNSYFWKVLCRTLSFTFPIAVATCYFLFWLITRDTMDNSVMWALIGCAIAEVVILLGYMYFFISEKIIESQYNNRIGITSEEQAKYKKMVFWVNVVITFVMTIGLVILTYQYLIKPIIKKIKVRS